MKTALVLYVFYVKTFENKTRQVLHLQYQVLFYGHRMKLQLSYFCHCHWSVVPLRFFTNNKIIILPLNIISQQYCPIYYISSTSHYILYIIYTLFCSRSIICIEGKGQQYYCMSGVAARAWKERGDKVIFKFLGQVFTLYQNER